MSFNFSELVDTHKRLIQQAAPHTAPPIRTSPRQIPTASSVSKTPPPIPSINFASVVGFNELPVTHVTVEPPLIIPRSPVGSSTDHHEPVRKGSSGSRISPRHLMELFSPRGSTGSLKNSPRTSLSQSSGEQSPRVQPLQQIEGGKAEAFNKRLRRLIRHFFSGSEEGIEIASQHPITKSDAVLRVRRVVDSYLSNEYSKAEVPDRRSNSPRSAEALSTILTTIRMTDVLTSSIVVRLEKMREKILGFFDESKKKTAWSVELENTVSALIGRSRDVNAFLEAFDSIKNKKITQLFGTVMKKGWNEQLKFMKNWMSPHALDDLRTYYAEINLQYEDLYKISQQKLFFTGETYALISKEFAERFVRELRLLGAMTVNEKPIDLEGLRSGSFGEKEFLVYFLAVVYAAKNVFKEPRELEQEVDNIYLGISIPSKLLLCGCLLPWNKFESKVRLIFKPLGPNVKTVPNAATSSITITAMEQGYLITKAITYDCYFMSTPEKGAVDSTCEQYGNKIAEVVFYWSLRIDENNFQQWEWMKWHGCIQIPEPPRLCEGVPYEIKSNFLTPIINFSAISEPSSIVVIPLNEEPQAVQAYMKKMKEKLDSSQTVISGEYISWYTLESYVKNVCRETIYTTEGEWSVGLLAETVWNMICTDGKILQPMISRLQKFREKLLDYVMEQPYRIEPLDQLFTILEMLITTKSLGVFVDLIDKGFKNPDMKQLVLHNMFGGYKQSLSGHDSQEPQRQHIVAIMDRLHVIVAGSEFLWKPLMEIPKTIECEDIETITKTPHQWVLSNEKVASLRKTPFKEIARTFIVLDKPILDELVINGCSINNETFTGTTREIHLSYFTKLLTVLYAFFDPAVTPEEIAAQVVHFVPENRDYHEVTVEQVPCLPLLQMCCVDIVHNSDRLFRNLFNLNHSPLQTNPEQGGRCLIEIQSKTEYCVEHFKTVGVYERAVPEIPQQNTTDRSRCLAKIPYSWKVFPYQQEEVEKILGTLHVLPTMQIFPIATPENKSLIYQTLYEYNTGFMNNPNWEYSVTNPGVKSPLGLPPLLKIASKGLKLTHA